MPRRTTRILFIATLFSACELPPVSSLTVPTEPTAAETADTAAPLPLAETVDTGEPRTTPPLETGEPPGSDPIAVTALQMTCNVSQTEIMLAPTIAGYPAAAVVNASDFANAPAYQEEHNFPTQAGLIEPLFLEIVSSIAEQTQDATSLFQCEAHWSEDSLVMAATVRLYDASGALADCEAGSENPGDAADILADAWQSPVGALPSNPQEFATCATGLALVY